MRSKDTLINKIKQIDDESILQELLKIVDLETKYNRGRVELSQTQKDFVKEGLKAYGEGETLSNEEVKRQTKKWFRGK